MKSDKTIVIAELKYALELTLWMARRYADKRSTYAPTDCNRAIDIALRNGVEVGIENDGKMYAEDGARGRRWVDGKFVDFVEPDL